MIRRRRNKYTVRPRLDPQVWRFAVLSAIVILAWIFPLPDALPAAGSPYVVLPVVALLMLAFRGAFVIYAARSTWVYHNLRSMFFTKITPVFVAVLVGAAVFEEVLFRGAVQSQTGIIVAAALFGMTHDTKGIQGIPTDPLWAFGYGLFFGYLAGYGLWAAIVMHVWFNLTAVGLSLGVRRWGRREEETYEVAGVPVSLGEIGVLEELSGTSGVARVTLPGENEDKEE